jgi:hypothetical protein
MVQDDGIHVQLDSDVPLPFDRPLLQPAVAAPEPAPKQQEQQQQEQQQQQQQQQQPAAEEDPLVDVCISCDGCGQSPLVGTRYKYVKRTAAFLHQIL